MENDEMVVRQTSRSLYLAIWLDVMPNSPASTDFGITSQEHYNAIYYAVKNGDLTVEQLDAVLGDGKMITALVNSVEGCNPKQLEFHTFWDAVYGRDMRHEQRSEAVETKNTQQRHHQRDRGMER